MQYNYHARLLGAFIDQGQIHKALLRNRKNK